MDKVYLDNKFDRQLRLWSDHGQQCLANSSVCLINCCGISSEILKNLVLPGIGSFTIIDASIVTKSDLGSNFFVNVESLGKFRALTVRENLLRHNPTVVGNSINDDIQTILDSNSAFLKQFSVIISTDPREATNNRLKKFCRAENIPLVICYTIGIIGYLQVIFNEHTIIESHPDSKMPSLSLESPLQELETFSSLEYNDILKQLKLSKFTLSAHDFSHIPWLLILHQFLKVYAEKNPEKPYPTLTREKNTFKEIIKEAKEMIISRLREEDPEENKNLYDLDNFEEACRALNTALYKAKIPDNIQEIFNILPAHLNLIKLEHETSTEKSPYQDERIFWALVASLKDFVDEFSTLPLRGEIPDMTSDTKRYLMLQEIYSKEHEKHVQYIKEKTLEKGFNIDIGVVRNFVKNAQYLRFLSGNSKIDENMTTAKIQELTLLSETSENDAFHWYLALRAACLFLDDYQRWPGCFKAFSNTSPAEMDAVTSQALASDQESNETLMNRDFDLLNSCLERIVKNYPPLKASMCSNHVKEMIRFGGGEIHTTSAFLAGIAAQEVIKLITHQFVPICEKPLIYNGIFQRIDLIDI